MDNNKKALITGITGSGGSYLAEYIIDEHPEFDVNGISRWHSTTSQNNLSDVMDKVQVHECDLLDLSSVIRTMKKIEPDYIFHLASHANVRTCFDTPISVLNNNIIGTANLLESIRLSDIDPRFMMCSTSEVYGQVDPKDVPIKESCQLNPVNPYAVSKVTQDLLSYTYFKNYGLKVIRTRMFAYLNPKRYDLFATSFARQVAKIELGLQKELLHGNLDSTRTIIDVRDAMEAYWYAIEKGKPGEVYNIGGNTIMTVGEFLEMLKKLAKTKIPSRTDPNLLRPTDVTLQIPDITKFKNETGWEPKYSFEQSIEHLLEYSRKSVKKEYGIL
jgi:GDP-4-dehydro-6-deoxy-D-mannose reductase